MGKVIDKFSELCSEIDSLFEQYGDKRAVVKELSNRYRVESGLWGFEIVIGFTTYHHPRL